MLEREAEGVVVQTKNCALSCHYYHHATLAEELFVFVTGGHLTCSGVGLRAL